MPHRQLPAVKVLLVDDEPASLLDLESVLHELGAELVCAASGGQALQWTQDQDFAAILLDVRMAGLGGLETGRLIRANPRSRITPLLFITDDGNHDLEDAYALGAVDFLTKPINPAVLKGKVSFFIELQRSRDELRRAQREQALREAQQVAVEQTNRTAAELAESDRRKTEFLATLAHELRNPLAPLRNGLHVLRLSRDEAARTRSWRMMDRQLTQMVRLIDDLLDVARISTGKIALKLQRVELRTVVESALETSEPAIEQAGHALEVDLPAPPVWLNVDATRIAQVLANLLSNAAKYTAAHGRIRLSARCEGGDLVLVVRDNGVGMTAQTLPRVFEMFTPVSSPGQHPPGGLGIGLALVRALVEMHGGNVTAESEGAGLGSTFTARLPVLDADEAPDPQVAPGGGLNVLLVDDNVDAAESMALILQMDGHATRVASNGRKALEIAADFRPQVVFLDIGMPGMDGYQVAKALLRQQVAHRPVLIALTGWGAKEVRARTKAAGFDYHLIKPASIEVVERLLESLRVAA